MPATPTVPVVEAPARVPGEGLEAQAPGVDMPGLEMPAPVAGRLGRLQAQLGIEGLSGVELVYSGKAAEGRTSLLTASALCGLLSSSLGAGCNLVNASMVARERGIRVAETTAAQGEDYTALIRLKVETSRGTSTLAGAIFGKREPRVVEIDGIAIEAIPVGHVLVFWNLDRPGLIGGIGTTLGRHGINIGQFQFGREKEGARAVTLVNVDAGVEETVLAELRALPNVLSVTQAHL